MAACDAEGGYLKIAKLSGPYYASNQLASELYVAYHLKHPAILSPSEIDVQSDSDGGITYTLQMERGVHPVLPVSDQQIWRLIDALAWLQQQGMCHGDIKPPNIIQMRDGHLKLIDFGLMYKPWWRHQINTQSYTKSLTRPDHDTNASFALAVTISFLATEPRTTMLTLKDLFRYEMSTSTLLAHVPDRWHDVVTRLVRGEVLDFAKLLPEGYVREQGVRGGDGEGGDLSSPSPSLLERYQALAIFLETNGVVDPKHLLNLTAVCLNIYRLHPEVSVVVSFSLAAGICGCSEQAIEPLTGEEPAQLAQMIKVCPQVLIEPAFVRSSLYIGNIRNALALLWRVVADERWLVPEEEIILEEDEDFVKTVDQLCPQLSHFICYDSILDMSIFREEEEEEEDAGLGES